MKYDSKKCNNLNFKLASGLSGFIKSAPNGDVYMYLNLCNWQPITMTMMPVYWKTVKAEAFDIFVEDSVLSIVPRDPETYKDWKVGDRVRCMSGAEVVYDIAAKLGEVVFLSKNHSQVLTLPINILVRDFKLILTDYEQELIHAEQEKKKECPFKEGDKVLVRDSDTSWKFDIFQNYEENACYSYECLGSEYEQCIPLNEHTWQLLGTTDEYDTIDNNESL